MTSQLLISGSPALQVSPTLAATIGLKEAIVLQQVHYWLNPKLNKNFLKGRYWVHNTYEQWQEQFPFWSERTICRTIMLLEDVGLLLSFVGGGFKKTKYYSINYDHDLLNPLRIPKGDQRLETLESGDSALSRHHDPVDLPERAGYGSQNDPIEDTHLTGRGRQNDLIEAPHLTDHIDQRTQGCPSPSVPYDQKGRSQWADQGGHCGLLNDLEDTAQLDHHLWKSLRGDEYDNKLVHQLKTERHSFFNQYPPIHESEKRGQSVYTLMTDWPVVKEDKKLKNVENEQASLSGQYDLSQEPNCVHRGSQNGVFNHANMAVSYPYTETTTESTHPPPLTPPPSSPNGTNHEEEDEEDFSEKMLEIWNSTVQRVLHPSKDGPFKGIPSKELPFKGVPPKDAHLTAKRKEQLNELLEAVFEGNLRSWEAYCSTIAQYRFLMGESPSGFKVTLDWALKPENAYKILEEAIFDKPLEKEEVSDSHQSWEDFFDSFKAHLRNCQHSEIWMEISRYVAGHIGQATFKAWFWDLVPFSLSGDTLTLQANSPFVRDTLLASHEELLHKACALVDPIITTLLITVKPRLKEEPASAQPAYEGTPEIISLTTTPILGA